MSCRNFETVITELARNMMLEAGARQNALAHLETCDRCSARLKDEQALTAGLRTVALKMEAAQAPPGVEAALLSAFRQRAVMPESPGAVQAAARTRGWLPWAMAAAAAIVVATLISVAGLLFKESSGAGVQAANSSQPTTTSPAPPERATGLVPDAGGQLVESGQDEEDEQAIQPAPERRRPMMHNAAFSNRRGRAAGSTRAGLKADDEITTDFVPLTYGGLSQVEDGQVVRVEMPRSTLQSFGLPVSLERPGGRVKADLLLGHDGVARAIRFVK